MTAKAKLLLTSSGITNDSIRRPLDGDVEITVMTFWESMDAIRGFAGNNPELAVVAPAAQAVLKSFDTTVVHHEIVVGDKHG